MAQVSATHEEGETEDNSLIARHEENAEINDEDESSDRDIPSTPSIRMIISLTTLGALDEMCYFPVLLVGHVFSPVQLCVGTILASGIILVVVLMFFSKFKPLVDFLDKIPLYGIVAMFAAMLTVAFCL